MLPRWSLFAAIPLVLALGFVSGVALSAYRPAPAPPQFIGKGTTTPRPGSATEITQPPAVADAAEPAALVPPVSLLRESPDRRRMGRRSAPLPAAVDQALDYPSLSPGESVGLTDAAPLPEVRTLVEAREALTREFNAFLVYGGSTFHVDYQLARDADYNTMVVGIIKIAEYAQWVRAVRESPAQLEAWLKAAAERIRPAAQKEKFSLAWTIFEVVTDPPFGFASREVTPMPRGDGYLVTRTLAAVTDFEQAMVSIAAVEAAQGSRPTAADTPWAAYGPVLRFDPTDLYRPANTATQP